MTLGCICKEWRHLRKGQFFLKKVSEFQIPPWGAPGVAILIFPALSIILQSPHSWLQWLYAFYSSQHWSLLNKEIAMLTYVFLREEGPRGALVQTPSKESCFFRSQALAWGKLIFTEFGLEGKGWVRCEGGKDCHSPAHCSHRVHWRPHIPLLCCTCQDWSWLGSYWCLTGTAFWPCCQRAWKGGVEPEKGNQGKGFKRMHRELIIVIAVVCQGATLTGHRRANAKPVGRRLQRSWNRSVKIGTTWTDRTKGIKRSRNSTTTVVPSLEPASSPGSKQEQTGTSASKNTGAFEILKREINYHLVLLSLKHKEHELCKPRDKRLAGRETKGANAKSIYKVLSVLRGSTDTEN